MSGPETRSPRQRHVDLAVGAAVVQVAGRPLHTYWLMLSPHVRSVFLPPQRRLADAGTGWTWDAPESDAPLTTVEIASVRTTWLEMLELLQDATGGRSLTRNEDPDGRLPLVAEALTAWSAPLLAAPDTALAPYVARTTHGLMVHSWGVSPPGQVQGPEASPADSAAPPRRPGEAGRKPRTHRPRRRWLVLAFAGCGLVPIGWWLIGSEGEPAQPADPSTSELVADYSARPSSAVPPSTESPRAAVAQRAAVPSAPAATSGAGQGRKERSATVRADEMPSPTGVEDSFVGRRAAAAAPSAGGGMNANAAVGAGGGIAASHAASSAGSGAEGAAAAPGGATGAPPPSAAAGSRSSPGGAAPPQPAAEQGTSPEHTPEEFVTPPAAPPAAVAGAPGASAPLPEPPLPTTSSAEASPPAPAEPAVGEDLLPTEINPGKSCEPAEAAPAATTLAEPIEARDSPEPPATTASPSSSSLASREAEASDVPVEPPDDPGAAVTVPSTAAPGPGADEGSNAPVRWHLHVTDFRTELRHDVILATQPVATGSAVSLAALREAQWQRSLQSRPVALATPVIRTGVEDSRGPARAEAGPWIELAVDAEKEPLIPCLLPSRTPLPILLSAPDRLRVAVPAPGQVTAKTLYHVEFLDASSGWALLVALELRPEAAPSRSGR